MPVTAWTFIASAAFIVGLPQPPALKAQDALEATRFVRASIKVSTSSDAGGGCCRIQPDGLVRATNATLRQLIQAAYQRHVFDEREISGLPEWADTVRFDVSARTSVVPAFDGDGSAPQLRSMLRNLLTDRFTLKIRVTKVERPIYTLVAATDTGAPALRLRRSDVDCGAVMASMIRGEPPAKPTCATASYPGRLVVVALPMSAIASLLSKSVGRIVVDRTGLAGRFDAELEAVEIRPPGPFGPSYRPSETTQSIFSSLPEQLGLELKSASASVEVLIVEHVEKPAEG